MLKQRFVGSLGGVTRRSRRSRRRRRPSLAWLGERASEGGRKRKTLGEIDRKGGRERGPLTLSLCPRSLPRPLNMKSDMRSGQDESQKPARNPSSYHILVSLVRSIFLLAVVST